MMFSSIFAVVTSYLFSFRFINFCWMIAVAGYGFKRWILPGLQAQIVAYKKFIALMRSSINTLEASQIATTDAIEKQEVLGRELFAKIGLWHEAVRVQHEQKGKHFRLFDHAFKTYKVAQKSAVERLYLQRDLSKDIEKVTLEKLQNVYAQEAKQKEYIEKVLVNFMKSSL